MVSIGKRKIVKTGSSKTITLPGDWLKGMNIDVGSEVEVAYDSVLLIKPQNLEIDEYFLLKQFRALLNNIKGEGDALGSISKERGTIKEKSSKGVIHAPA